MNGRHPSPFPLPTQDAASVFIQAPKAPRSQLVRRNEGSLDTHRGASEASRARGTRLTTVSLEDKEANWREALAWGRREGVLEGQVRRRGPEGARADSKGGGG